MIGAGLWVRRKDRLKRIHQPRARRDCLGELVQIDGSEHWWFEDRGPQSTLLVYVDDATSRLMHLRFVETESTFDYFQATREYLEAHGKPVAFYSDKARRLPGQQQRRGPGRRHDPVRTVATRRKQRAASSAPTRPCKTASSRNCVFREISTIAAGNELRQWMIGAGLWVRRKDRLKRIHQPRARRDCLGELVQIDGSEHWWFEDRGPQSTLLVYVDDATSRLMQLLPGFLADYNTRFGKEPRNPKNLHRPLSAGDDLTDVFAWRESGRFPTA